MQMNWTTVTDMDEMFQGRFKVCYNPGKELVRREGKTGRGNGLSTNMSFPDLCKNIW